MRGLSVGWPVDIEDVVEALPCPVEEELGDLPGGELVAVLQDLIVLHTPHLEQTQHCLSGEGLETNKHLDFLHLQPPHTFMS